ncbi:MAG: polyketide cyclase [Candidatus Ozemobacteraceae bacterium]
MWSKSFNTRVRGLTAPQVWKVWTDVNQWHKWQPDIEYARLTGEFQEGNTFLFKPQGGSEIKIELTSVIPNRSFVDVTRFPLAQMYDSHEIIDHGEELEIKSTISLSGFLSFLWRKLVVEEIANGLEAQTKRLIEEIKNQSSSACPP